MAMPNRIMRSLVTCCVVCWVCNFGGLSGCTVWRPTTGTLRAESLGQAGTHVDSQMLSAVYTDALTTEITFYVSDQPLSRLMDEPFTQGQCVRVELLWQPQAGRTPLGHYATNSALRYVIVVGDEVGVYAGGGFAMISGNPGDEQVHITLRDSALRLQEHTPGFVDHLGAMHLTGSIVAEYRPELAERVHRKLSQRVTDALGRMYLVSTTPQILMD